MDIKGRKIRDGEPVYIIAEVGINHNGDIEQATELIRRAAEAGVDAVKFQYRVLPHAIPEHMREQPKVLGDGTVVTYLEYKKSIELPQGAHIELSDFAHSVGLDYGVSIWDTVGGHIMADLGTFTLGVEASSKIDFLNYLLKDIY